ncbi:hypothetical protein GCK32_002306 [Trichostrongylus colubriformis]|uniref:NADAR domain-containing protein n=1 Tax=Trichostrongylus colubriformis TaxID=6319 RepID=A0AAN8ESX8_TRICO
MFNRTKTKNFRVEVLLPSPRRKGRMGKHPNLWRRPRTAGPRFDSSRCPTFLEDGVVVVDNSMKPSTSERSVELTRSEPLTSVHSAENKRNRLYAPLSALSSRLHSDQPEQFRRSHSVEETGSIVHQHISRRHDVPMQQNSKEAGREVVFCNGSASSVPSARKPLPMKSFDQRATPSSASGFCKKGRDIVIRRDFQESPVANPSSRKRPAPTNNDVDMPSSSEAHVHKSETLTVIIPQRKAALSRQEPKPSHFIKATDSSPSAVENIAATPKSQPMKSPVSLADDEVKLSTSPVALPAEPQPVAEKPANGHSKNEDELQPVSDDESSDEDGELIDPLVVKSSVSDENFIPYSSETHAFSNHQLCRHLLIHEQNFSSAEQFYMWTKARFCKDFSAANAVLYLKDPKMIKQVDSQLKNVDMNEWMKFSWKVRMKAAMAKFKQNRRMRYQLFRTIGSTLVEANVDDTYWGIGLSIDDPNIADPSKWRGANVMGEVLMQIRDVLKDDPDFSDEVEQAKRNLIGSR